MRSVVVALALIAATTATAAETLAPPSVAYRADMRIQAGRLAMSGPIHITPKMERRSLKLNGTSVPARIIILRRDKGVGWVVDASTRSYYRVPMARTATTPTQYLSGTLVEKTKLGGETIDGIKTTRYRVKFAAGKSGQLVGEIWITPQNIVMRFDGRIVGGKRETRFRLSLTKLKIGPQPAALFAPPKDYEAVPASHPTKGILVRPAPAK